MCDFGRAPSFPGDVSFLSALKVGCSSVIVEFLWRGWVDDGTRSGRARSSGGGWFVGWRGNLAGHDDAVRWGRARRSGAAEGRARVLM
jgi:hypothetical protein